MSTPFDHLKSRLAVSGRSHIPKGELWLGTKLFSQSGLEDTLENHIQMAEELGHDLVCLSVAGTGADKADLGYRYFDGKAVGQAARDAELPVCAVVDGPFQELCNRMGLMEVLTGWISDRDELFLAYKKIAEETLALIDRVMTYPLAAITVTDDFSSENGPFVNPKDIETLCTPFYVRATQMVRSKGAAIFLHSCGKLSQLLPAIRSWQMDGLVAVQSEVNDVPALSRAVGKEGWVLTGVESELLSLDPFPVASCGRLATIVRDLVPKGRLILGSSCGLYQARHLSRIKEIYRLADTWVS